MNRQLETAWDYLRSFISSFHFAGLVFEAQGGYLFLPPVRVLEQFLFIHPKHQSCRAKLLDRLRGSAFIEYGKVRVARDSKLGIALAA